MLGGGRNKGGSSARGPQSWKNLAGAGKKRVNSPQARKRRFEQRFKIFRALAILVGLTLIIIFLVAQFRKKETSIQITPPSEKIERIIFNTNGVLPDNWIGSVLKLKQGTTMMEADIHALKSRIEAVGQVKHVSIERIFPSDLKINVEEHTPVLRLAFENKAGKRSMKIIGTDGTIYKGVGYPKAGLKQLPFVMPYIHPQGGYKPMNGIEHVARLLDLAKKTQPRIFQTWDVISLTHYSGDLELPGQVIEIRSTIVPRILFSASGDFERQLERLVYILEYIQARGNPSIERIDLSLNGAAAVQFTSGRIGTF